MFRLIYKSTSNIATAGHPFNEDILSILEHSRTLNPVYGVTGALMASNSQFAQVLEGEREALRVLYGRIACDPRHRFCTLLQFEPVNARTFGDWSMAFVDEERQRRIPLSARPPGSDLTQPSVSASGILSLLQFLAREGEP
ncbi:BLUF domain-containing protein [Pararoseomonas indoligenes]|uniref:BLUF domain-containing protein n=1 Tax=Roseomonas indoligenes TaxID=2820811 RepID=A0A940N3B6_9PROT|nr:BLUF domain-containing protein [Pararoseomonas indoligenes]MBP0495947.1 BLUF domain-containing protein [Pararoseomonas indoligenes]